MEVNDVRWLAGAVDFEDTRNPLCLSWAIAQAAYHDDFVDSVIARGLTTRTRLSP